MIHSQVVRIVLNDRMCTDKPDSSTVTQMLETTVMIQMQASVQVANDTIVILTTMDGHHEHQTVTIHLQIVNLHVKHDDVVAWMNLVIVVSVDTIQIQKQEYVLEIMKARSILMLQKMHLHEIPVMIE